MGNIWFGDLRCGAAVSLPQLQNNAASVMAACAQFWFVRIAVKSERRSNASFWLEAAIGRRRENGSSFPRSRRHLFVVRTPRVAWNKNNNRNNTLLATKKCADRVGNKPVCGLAPGRTRDGALLMLSAKHPTFHFQSTSEELAVLLTVALSCDGNRLGRENPPLNVNEDSASSKLTSEFSSIHFCHSSSANVSESLMTR